MEKLTAVQVLEALEWCRGGSLKDDCAGCPNAGEPNDAPGMEGFCHCKYDLYEEAMRVIKELMK